MDEKSEEDGEPESWVGVVGCISYETLRDFVEGDGGRGLQTDSKEGIGWNVMVVLCGVRGVRMMRRRSGRRQRRLAVPLRETSRRRTICQR